MQGFGCAKQKPKHSIEETDALRENCQVLVQIRSFVYYFTMLGLLPRSSAAVGYSVLLFVPKNPLLFGCTQCNEVVDTPFPINVVFTSSAAFSGVFFTLILVGFRGRNIAPNMAQCNNIPENCVNHFFPNTIEVLKYARTKAAQLITLPNIATSLKPYRLARADTKGPEKSNNLIRKVVASSIICEF
ncbi:hypothetical protein ALC56_04618 [Trachymyrmex septentrionalis]|uniref:Uncharacterized protein n=1 Tax=Trachymyrmex septentrionalis TaxID=34720 RepID=A0A195FK30_9HYME|nr:hypothetical protein ALC56_04618 [Trachymyrmex septentrionalis]